MERGLWTESGKIASLSALVEQYTSELEYDLWTRCNQTDLLDLWRGGTKLTYRRLQMFIDGLPPESRLKTAMRDGLTMEQHAEIDKIDIDPNKHGIWSHSDMLSALIVDELRKLYWLLHAVNVSKRSDQMKYPEPLSRPGVVGKLGSPALVQRRIKKLRDLAKYRGKPPTEEEAN